MLYPAELRDLLRLSPKLFSSHMPKKACLPSTRDFNLMPFWLR